MITASLRQTVGTMLGRSPPSFRHIPCPSLTCRVIFGEANFHGRNTRRGMVTLRRPRKKYEKYDLPEMGHQVSSPRSSIMGMDGPFRYSGDSLDEYSKKASLSPWTPVPDSVARRIFDLANPTPEDVHVELGSGDGRVNFFAIEAGVKQSIGIDIDEDIVKVATDRLNRIHPKPNLEFIVADLMETNNPAWAHVKEATILSMFFAKEGLKKIQPLLELALRGKRCKVFCCGYPMQGWDYQICETVLDMPIHYYDWGNPEVETLIGTGQFVENIPMDMIQMNMMDKFSKGKSNFRPDPLPGYHPDDFIDYGWDNFSDDEDDDEPEDKKTK